MIAAEVIRLCVQCFFAAFNYSVIAYIRYARRNNPVFRTDFFGLFLTVSTLEFVDIVLVSLPGRTDLGNYSLPKAHQNPAVPLFPLEISTQT